MLFESGFFPLQIGDNLKGTAAIYNAPSNKSSITKNPSIIDMVSKAGTPSEVVDTPTSLAAGTNNKTGSYLLIGVVLIAAVLFLRRK